MRTKTLLSIAVTLIVGLSIWHGVVSAQENEKATREAEVSNTEESVSAAAQEAVTEVNVRAENDDNDDDSGSSGGTTVSPNAFRSERRQLEAHIANWPKTAHEAALETYDKYGYPNEVTPTRLIWHDNGPWKRTIVYREEVDHHFPKPHKDVLEQFIDYRVPLDKYDDLAQYDGSVIVERTKGEISARCDKEGLNFLALNLSHDIATGKRTIQDARATYAEHAAAFLEGRVTEYTAGLRFDPEENAADPDSPFAPR